MLITGIDVPVPELELILHQPTIKEIAFIGELEYFSTLQILCFNRDILIAKNSSGSSYLEAMNNFDIFMTLIGNSKGTNIKNDIINVLTLFLPTFEITFLPQHFGIQLHSSQLNKVLIINDSNFDAFRQAINDVSAISHSAGKENSTFNPKDKRAAEIAAKIMRGRAKAAQYNHETNNGILARYVSILTIGTNSMSLQACLNLTLYQLYDLVERYGLYVGWDLDIRSRLAGGKPDKSPDDWMKDIH